MKFGQSSEYTMKNIFLEKLYAKCDGETIPRSFVEKSELSVWSASLNLALEQQFKVVCQFVFTVCQVDGYGNILKLRCRALAFISYKYFF